jgi:hypothetical protein
MNIVLPLSYVYGMYIQKMYHIGDNNESTNSTEGIGESVAACGLVTVGPRSIGGYLTGNVAGGSICLIRSLLPAEGERTETTKLLPLIIDR